RGSGRAASLRGCYLGGVRTTGAPRPSLGHPRIRLRSRNHYSEVVNSRLRIRVRVPTSASRPSLAGVLRPGEVEAFGGAIVIAICLADALSADMCPDVAHLRNGSQPNTE